MAKKKKPVEKAPDDMSTWTHEEEYPQAEPWPEGFDTWTQEQVDAWGLQKLREALAYVPTEEERAIFEHFMDKQDSAHLAFPPEEPKDRGQLG